MSFFSPSRKSTKSKIAMFEQSSTASSTKRPHGGLRAPLGFLSPNRANVASPPLATTMNGQDNAVADKEEVSPTAQVVASRLQKQVDDLRDRIETFDQEEGESQLMLVDGGTMTMDEAKMNKLQTKLQKIQTGLLDIEQERLTLVNKAQRLETERDAIRKELEHREREIASLSRRCSTQADKMKEAIKLQASNRELSKQVQELQERLEARNRQEINLGSVARDLEICQKERDDLRARLDGITKDHDVVAENLRQCLVTIEALTREKHEWEEERRRLQRRADMERDQQRLEHSQKTFQLEQDVKAQYEEVASLQALLEKKTEMIAELQQRQTQQENDFERAHHESLSVLAEQFTVEANAAKNVYTEKLAELKAELENRDKMIATLEVEISTCMGELMVATQSLATAEEESTLFRALTMDVECLHEERVELTDLVLEKETEIAELSAEIIKLEIEREFLEQKAAESTSLKEIIDSLEQSKADLEHQLMLQKEGSDNTIQRLEADLAETEQKLRLVLDRFDFQHNRESAGMDSTITVLENAIMTYESDARAKDQTIESLKRRLEMLDDELLARKDESIRVTEQLRLDHDNEVSTLVRRVEALEQVVREKDVALAEEQATRERAVSSLKQSLQESHDRLFDRDSSNSAELAELRKQLKQIKASTTIKDDELRELRVIDIPELEDQLSKSKNEAAQLRLELEKEKECKQMMALEMQKQIDGLNERLKESDRRESSRTKKNKEKLSELTKSVEEWRKEVEIKEVVIRGQERRLKEIGADFVMLSQRLTLQAQEEASLRAQYDKLQSEAEEARDNVDKLTSLLEEVMEQRNQAEEANKDADALRISLEEELRATEGRLASQNERIASLEVVLQGKADLLTDMISKNAALETDLKNTAVQLAELKCEKQATDSALSESNEQLKRLRIEWSRKEGMYLDDLNTERNLREIADASLDELSSKLEKAQKQNKACAELEREVESLRDKVRRQESFLKRKLEKERIQRDRATKTPAKTPAKTPLRSGIQPPKVRSAVVSRSTRSTLSDSSYSLDWELDSLLAE